MPDLDLQFLVDKKPEEIVKYFSKKGNLTNWSWRDTWEQAHAKAFTAAKAMKLDILQDIRTMVERSIAEGLTYKEFQKGLQPKLIAAGWWGKMPAKDVPIFDPASGEDPDKIVQLGSPRRLKTIYRTNALTSYNAGRYKSQYDNKSDRPFGEYVQIERPSKRRDHAEWHRRVFRLDDPIWDRIYPPNGFGCGCRVRTLTEADVKERGLQIEDGSRYEGTLADEGWNYNPGKAAFYPNLDDYSYNVAKQFTAGGLTGPDFKNFFNLNTEGNFPVAVLSPEYRRLLQSETQVVYLSTSTLKKNKMKHDDLAIADYENLPSIIQEAQLIIQDGELTFVYIKRNGKFYHASIKVTGERHELYLTSFRTTNIASMNRKMKKGEVLKNELEPDEEKEDEE